jgi:hypothetical protein
MFLRSTITGHAMRFRNLSRSWQRRIALGRTGPLARSPTARQNFPLNLPIKRRLCSTVGWCRGEGFATHSCAVSAARSRAATMTNLARSSLAFALSALFGAAKSCAVVKLFMIFPPMIGYWLANRSDSTRDSRPSHGGVRLAANDIHGLK